MKLLYGSLIAALLLIVCAGSAWAQPKPAQYQPSWESLDKRPIPGWFDEAKFGIFIHWGVYSVPSWGPKGTYAEWYWNAMQNREGETWKFHARTYGERFQYQDFTPMFRAELFDPAQWADLFARSGARYVVLTSKHHEGFTLWPNAESWNWNSVDVGPHRDLCGDLAKAVRDRGLKMGFYYSLYEWYHPLYQNDLPRFVREHFHPQFKDLVTRYQPSLIFADGEWDHSSQEWKSEELLAWLFNESSCREEVVINDRWGKDSRSHHGGYYTTEYGEVGGGASLAEGRKWEESRGIGASYGYNRNETLEDYQTPHALICLLVNLVAKGGNLLIDIGPTADGRVPVIMQERLLEMGEWLKTNGEAIYGTRPWKVSGEGPTADAKGAEAQKKQVFVPTDIRFTSKENAVYAICLALPSEPIRVESMGKADLPDGAAIARLSLLGSEEPLKWSQEQDALVIQRPKAFPSQHAAAFKIELAK